MFIFSEIPWEIAFSLTYAQDVYLTQNSLTMSWLWRVHRIGTAVAAEWALSILNNIVSVCSWEEEKAEQLTNEHEKTQ